MEISVKIPEKKTEHIGKAKIDIPEKIAEFCRKHHIRRLSFSVRS